MGLCSVPAHFRSHPPARRRNRNDAIQVCTSAEHATWLTSPISTLRLLVSNPRSLVCFEMFWGAECCRIRKSSRSTSITRHPRMPGGNDVRAFQGLTTTLAWFSPISSRYQGYRWPRWMSAPLPKRNTGLNLIVLVSQPTKRRLGERFSTSDEAGRARRFSWMTVTSS